MHHEHAYHPAPFCPSCGATMRFMRSVAKIGGLPELQTFECRVCGVSLTQAHEPKVLEIASAVGRFS